MQLEAEVRTNLDLRAARFVQRWQALSQKRDSLTGYNNADARQRVEKKMTKIAGGLRDDKALEVALVKRAGDLGLSRQWALEWRPDSRDGGIGRDMMDRLRAPSISDQLIAGLGIGQDRALGL